MNTTPMKQIVTEIWEIAGEKVFSGKRTLEFVNRETGKVQTFELVSETTNENFIIQNDGTSKLHPDEVYGSNGYHRSRWVEGKIAQQTKDFEEEEGMN